MSFSALHLRNRYGIYLKSPYILFVFCAAWHLKKTQSHELEKNSPPLGLTIGEKTLKSLVG